MTPRRWALVAWGAFLVVLIGFAAIDGGRNCEVPKAGPFHLLLKGQTYVPSGWHRVQNLSCRRVK
jgi:hypothetical protein